MKHFSEFCSIFSAVLQIGGLFDFPHQPLEKFLWRLSWVWTLRFEQCEHWAVNTTSKRAKELKFCNFRNFRVKVLRCVNENEIDSYLYVGSKNNQVRSPSLLSGPKIRKVYFEASKFKSKNINLMTPLKIWF